MTSQIANPVSDTPIPKPTKAVKTKLAVASDSPPPTQDSVVPTPKQKKSSKKAQIKEEIPSAPPSTPEEHTVEEQESEPKPEGIDNVISKLQELQNALKTLTIDIKKHNKDHLSSVKKLSQMQKKKSAEPDTTEENSETQLLVERNDALLENIQTMSDTFKALLLESKKVKKDHASELKDALKKQKKVKAPRDFSKIKKPTGFAEPLKVSDELYSFLIKTGAVMKDPTFQPKSEEDVKNWPKIKVVKGKPVARTDVTSHISKYIREHNLQNPENKKQILPDANLKNLFEESESGKYDYLGLQKYVRHHFPKKQ